MVETKLNWNKWLVIQGMCLLLIHYYLAIPPLVYIICIFFLLGIQCVIVNSQHKITQHRITFEKASFDIRAYCELEPQDNRLFFNLFPQDNRLFFNLFPQESPFL